MTIYDILRELVDRGQWREESEVRERIEAINAAERNNVFGVEGRFDLSE